MKSVMRTFLFSAIVSSVCLLCDQRAPASETVTLAGEWRGTWTDSRKEYSSSGGAFTGSVVDKAGGGWSATFYVGRQTIFKVELSGRREDGKVVFDTTV